MVKTGKEVFPDDAGRAKDWDADRVTEELPLPFAHERRYTSAVNRQVDLEAAERAGIAKEAGNLGLTTREWRAMRERLGRSPTADDVRS